MWKARGAATIACSIALSSVFAVPGFTQSNTASRPDSAGALLSATALPVMRVYGTGDHGAGAAVELPPNLTYGTLYRDVLQSMVRRSPTFRRQCLRIANTTYLTVTVRGAASGPRSAARARTQIVRAADRLEAMVEIRVMQDSIELIAHELEHVIEQLDGIDLKVQSSLSRKGVTRIEDGSFETIRAVQIGQQVARETRAGQ